jgi:hypothetical protein
MATDKISYFLQANITISILSYECKRQKKNLGIEKAAKFKTVFPLPFYM